MSETMERWSLAKRQMMVGRTKRLFDEGCSVKEICEELKLSESTVRSIKHTIDEAEKNKNK
jgi:DNA-binding NarL/FixJ family response regulator